MIKITTFRGDFTETGVSNSGAYPSLEIRYFISGYNVRMSFMGEIAEFENDFLFDFWFCAGSAKIFRELCLRPKAHHAHFTSVYGRPLPLSARSMGSQGAYGASTGRSLSAPRARQGAARRGFARDSIIITLILRSQKKNKMELTFFVNCYIQNYFSRRKI